MERLKKRADFAAAARGRRIEKPGFVLQAAAQRHGPSDGPRHAPSDKTARFGFTVTKKLGNAAMRNRIRRRLKEAVRIAGADHATAGMDYVVVGRRAALSLPFDRLTADLVDGLKRLSAVQVEAAPAGSSAQPGRADGQ